MSNSKLFETDRLNPLNKPSLKQNRIGWISLVALAYCGLNQSLLLFSLLLTNQGTMGLLLLIVGIVIIWAAMPGWIELVLMYPNKVGGIAACAAHVFGRYAPTLGCLIGTSYWLAWGSTVAFGAIFTASALQVYFPSLPKIPFAMVVLISMTLLNLTGIKWTARVMIVSSGIAFLLAVLSALLPTITGKVDWLLATHFELITPFPGTFGAFTSLMSGLYLVAFSAPAIEHALNYVRETKNPNRNVPIAAYVTAALAGLYYIALPIIWFGVIGEGLKVDQDGLKTALVPVFSTHFITPQVAQFAAVIFVLTNSWIYTAAGLACISRVLAQIAADGYAPSFFSELNRAGAPWKALMASFILGAIIVLSGVPTWLIAGSNMSYLIAICSATIAVWLMRRVNPHHYRPYRAPISLIRLSLVGVGIWTLSTIFGFQQYGLSSVIIGMAFVYMSLVFLVWRSFLRSKKPKPYTPRRSIFNSLHFKLTASMLFILSLDAAGYLIAVKNMPDHNTPLVVLLEDIFILVALLTINVGLLIPSLIIKSVKQINHAAKQLAFGTLADFSRAMKALGSGQLEAATVQMNVVPVAVNTKDEIGEMATSFNEMQAEVKRSAISLIKARQELSDARTQILEGQAALQKFNETLEKQVEERTQALEDKNVHLHHEITERKRAEAEVAELNNQLIISAREIGMAEISTAILHNIGNVIKNANVSMEIAAEHINQIRLEKLDELAKMLDENIDQLDVYLKQDPKGKLLIPYLTNFSKSKSRSLEVIEREIKSLNDNISHIKDIIQTQQSLVGAQNLLEKITIQEAFDATLKLMGTSFSEQGIVLETNFKGGLELLTDRTKLYQILVNLLQNAKESVLASENTYHWIKFSVKASGEMILICIDDNGVGIALENLTRIFSFGYSTKQKGHGIGLHSCALVAKELGGSLHAESKGVGQGASFILALPLMKTTKTTDDTSILSAATPA